MWLAAGHGYLLLDRRPGQSRACRRILPQLASFRCGICHSPDIQHRIHDSPVGSMLCRDQFLVGGVCRLLRSFFDIHALHDLVYGLWFRTRPRQLMAESQTRQRNTLKAIVAFADLSPDAIERIERRCAWKHYSPGEPILDYLDKSDDVFFLALGEVRVTIYSTAGKAVSFRELG